jgi:hypothetical protein
MVSKRGQRNVKCGTFQQAFPYESVEESRVLPTRAGILIADHWLMSTPSNRFPIRTGQFAGKSLHLR